MFFSVSDAVLFGLSVEYRSCESAWSGEGALRLLVETLVSYSF